LIGLLLPGEYQGSYRAGEVGSVPESVMIVQEERATIVVEGDSRPESEIHGESQSRLLGVNLGPESAVLHRLLRDVIHVSHPDGIHPPTTTTRTARTSSVDIIHFDVDDDGTVIDPTRPSGIGIGRVDHESRRRGSSSVVVGRNEIYMFEAASLVDVSAEPQAGRSLLVRHHPRYHPSEGVTATVVTQQTSTQDVAGRDVRRDDVTSPRNASPKFRYVPFR